MPNLGSFEMLLMVPFMIMTVINLFLPFVTLVLAVLIINYVRRIETKLDYLMRHQPGASQAPPTAPSHSAPNPPHSQSGGSE
ncbi:MAG: hypothetical protein P9L94_01190 [Candidatus Hinthialibacter antarcticus]|nr:hypothetical protein [Candidatus Hinthialibacter antarcticus]